jgi:hypothetical protein
MKTIQLNNSDKVAIVDDEDYGFLSQFVWSFEPRKNQSYATRVIFPDGTKASKRSKRMHQEILQAPKGFMVDHKDGDGLNNRRENLRICNRSQNAINSKIRSDNTVGYKGVSIHSNQRLKKRFVAQITFCKKHIFIGCFLTAEEAARAYDSVAREKFGEFAYVNF